MPPKDVNPVTGLSNSPPRRTFLDVVHTAIVTPSDTFAQTVQVAMVLLTITMSVFFVTAGLTIYNSHVLEPQPAGELLPVGNRCYNVTLSNGETYFVWSEDPDEAAAAVRRDKFVPPGTVVSTNESFLIIAEKVK